jgi:hypothetical protein
VGKATGGVDGKGCTVSYRAGASVDVGSAVAGTASAGVVTAGVSIACSVARVYVDGTGIVPALDVLFLTYPM